MLLPSSIQRAEVFVGIAMPTVGLLCARAPLPDATVARLASASPNNVVFRLGIFTPFNFFAVDLDDINRGYGCGGRRRPPPPLGVHDGLRHPGGRRRARPPAQQEDM